MSNFVMKRELGGNPGRRRHADGSVRRCTVATRTYLLLAAIVGATCLASASTAQVRLPDFGDAAEEELSPAEERVLGEAFMRAVRARLTLVDDPLVEQYVRSLGYRLVASSDRRDLAFTFFVVEDSSLNAFAAPGGFIGVNSGLIAATRSESEFASVLAHEIAHVTQRHIARAIQHGSRSNLPVLAGILAAVIVGTQNVEAGQATAAAVIGSSAQRQINFTRHNEMEADRVGIRMLADAGFDPREMADVFEKLQNAARYSQRPPEYLSTHPSPRTESQRRETVRPGFPIGSTRARNRTTSSAPVCGCATPTMRSACSGSSPTRSPRVKPRASSRMHTGKRSRWSGSAARRRLGGCSNA